ncbi:hypothetical protein DDV96_02965 [Marixanthomonas spongiae]|uniref:HU domain-containing protein n=1 Tax=Marixanthomonas spongiae TaxID=2174845 RepID=A0A2U0I568_9FLAO|nr:hypothetical protein DDV96_02965 [Marixanthomonas spongiae]
MSRDEVAIEQLSYEIRNDCTLTQTDVYAILETLGRKMKSHLEDGKTETLVSGGLAVQQK